MRKALTIPAALLLLFGVSAALAGECICDAAAAKDGWCTECKVGHINSVKVGSEKLYAALEGETVSSDEMKCGGCKTGLAQNASCKDCNVSFAAGKSYKSWVGHDLATGKLVDSAEIKCAGCKEASKDHGWCDDCKGGMVANRGFKDKEAYEQAVKAHATLVKATKKADKCEGCAVAMVTDSDCAHCKVSFKDGEMVKAQTP